MVLVPPELGLAGVQVRPVYDALAPLAPNAAALALKSIEASRNNWQSSSPARLAVDGCLDSPTGLPRVSSDSLFPLEDV